MNLIDQQRIAWAVARYEFWMDNRGVPSKVRKGLRRELQANLTEATAHEGSRAAVLAIGSPKALAYAAGEAHESRPRWTFGITVAGLVLAALSYAWMFSIFGFADGVLASGSPAGRSPAPASPGALSSPPPCSRATPASVSRGPCPG